MMGQDNSYFRAASQRRGVSVIWPLAGIVVASGVGLAVWKWGDARGNGNGDETSLVVPVSLGRFEHFVVERGDLESAENVEIRCQVQGRGMTGTPILKIRPAGEYVKKGDFLVSFDDSLLQTELVKQEGLHANNKALRIQAENILATAKAAYEEYINGTSKQELELARSEMFVAEENLRRAQESLRFSERLAARNYINAVQLDAERFAVKKASKDLEAAQTKLDVVQNHTYPKMAASLKAEISKADAQLTAALAAEKLDEKQLEYLKDQIAKCYIVAPQDGQVVYAMQGERNRDEQVVIEEGTVVREGQVVIRLPDTKQMRVRAVINESRINLIRKGAPVKVELDADPDNELDGVISAVEAFPIPRRWHSTVKEYGAIVDVTSQSPMLRPGLRAKVRIFVDRADNVLQVPIQSVVEHQGGHYCLVRDDEKWTAKRVDLGPNNDKFVVVRDGLAAGDSVAIDPRSYLDEVDLPAGSPTSKVADKPRRGGRRGANERKPDLEADRKAESGPTSGG
jgi:multidrug efflux pump subunit AcrA (membrane-fusion protein)